MATDAARAERAMSAPAAVVFNTATDPDRLAAWLPRPLRDAATGAEADDPDPDRTDGMRARWSGSGWLAELTVVEVATGGARVRLELRGDPPDDRLAAIADESLASLAGAVADNFTAG